MFKKSFKKLVTAVALSLTLALTIPTILPAITINNVATVEAASAKISQDSATMLAGQTLKLKISNKGKKSVTWSTSNKSVATVKNGTVTAIGKGKAKIKAIVGKKVLTCTVSVKSNTYSINTYILSKLKDSGSVYLAPTSVYYKNGKLYCKTSVINNAGYTIKFIGDKKGNTPKQLKATLKAYTFASDANPTETSTVLAKGTVKASLPQNIKNNKSKTFTVEFSGSQIKKKGFALSSLDFIDLELSNKLYTYQ